MASFRKKGKTIHSDAREIINHVNQQCKKEAEQKQLLVPIPRADERTAKYCGVSVGTIKNIRQENEKRREGSRLRTPGKSRPRNPERNVNIDDFDICIIKRTIIDFYASRKMVPTCKKLLPVVRSSIDFPWGEQSLRRVIHKMGFRWRKCHGKRTVLIEKPRIVEWRCKYIAELREYRRQGRNIVYLDETWMDMHLTFKKCWQAKGVTRVLTDESAGNKLIVAHACSENGFIPGALLIYNAGSVTGGYHGQMNGVNFERWVNERLVPNLPEKSVIILDNAPYHTIQVNKPPNKYDTKINMMSWLQENGVHYEENMPKYQLYSLIEMNRAREKVFKIERILSAHGHTTLYLPPYNYDLNPLELAWVTVNHFIREHIVTGEFSLPRLSNIINEGISSITSEHWSGYHRHVRKLEEDYWSMDRVVSDVIDEIIISKPNDSSSDEEEGILSEDSSSESSASELACALD